MSVPSYCPRCGKPLKERENVCSNCGLNFETQDPAEENPYSGVPARRSAWQEIGDLSGKIDIRLLCFGILAACVFVLSFWAAGRISDAAGQILQIRTSDGHTVNEVYYREVAGVYQGLALFFRACGVFFAAVLAEFGLSRKKREN